MLYALFTLYTIYCLKEQGWSAKPQWAIWIFNNPINLIINYSIESDILIQVCVHMGSTGWLEISLDTPTLALNTIQ